METQNFRDRLAYDRGYNGSIPPEQTAEVGDVAAQGKNVLFSPYGQPTSWRGVSLVNQPAAALLQLVGDKIGGIGAGNVLLGPGGSVWFIGAGKAFYDDFTKPLGVASSLLQFHYQGQTYQAGLPAPPAPLLTLALDSLGQAQVGRAKGRIAAALTRRRSATGAESAASLVSNVLQANNNRIAVQFPPALSVTGQDEWGVYFTRAGFETGTLFLLRVVKDAEISATIGASAGQGLALATVTALSSSATNGRIAAYALAPSGGSPATVRDTATLATAGNQTSLRLSKPLTVADGDKLLVGLSVDQTHTITADSYNGGFVAPVAVTGAWQQVGSIGNPNGETVLIEQINATQFQWKLASAGAWSSPLNLATTPTPLGATGLAVTWSASSSGLDQVGNRWSIAPLAVYAPSGWTLENLVAGTNDNGSLLIFSRTASASEPEFFEFTVSAATRLTASLVVVAGAASGISKRIVALTAGTTTHSATFGTAPAANERVIAFFAGAGQVTFTPQGGLIGLGDASQASRVMEFDVSDGDLLEIEAPLGVEGPPAGTHAFTLGSVMVIVGTFDGTALSPSQPNQFEQYDLANTVYLNPVEPPIRVEARPHDGSVYIMTRNSIQVPVFTGVPDLPILTRALWPTTGIANPNAATMTPRGMYGFSERGGAVRSSGREEPDTAFARPVELDMSQWLPENVVITNDRRNGGMVLFCHERQIYVYFESHGRWSTPLDISDFYYYIRQSAADGAMTAGSYEFTSPSNPFTSFDQGKFITVIGAGANGGNLDTIIESVTSTGALRLRDAASTTISAAGFSWGADVSQVRIVSALTHNGRAYLAIGDEGYSELYEFHCGLGTNWNIRSIARHGGQVGKRKTLRNVKLLADFNSQIALRYNRLQNLRVSGNRLLADSVNADGQGVSDVFFPKNTQYGQTVYWEWELQEPLRKERGAILAKASELRPTPTPGAPLSNLTYGDGLVGWRVDDQRKLTVYAATAGTTSGTVGTSTAPVSVTTATLAAGTAGNGYDASLLATGGSTPYVWEISAGALPPGLALSQAGRITGTPTTAGTYSFTARVTDVNGGQATQALSITIAAAPAPSALNVPFRATASTNIVTTGLALRKSDNVTSLANLCIEDANGNKLPAAFRLHTGRWNALVSDTSAPIKWVLVDFTPPTTGNYFLKASGSNPAHATPVTATNGASEITIQTGTFEARLPKTGFDLLSVFKHSGTERLATGSKPRMGMPSTPSATLVKWDNTFGQYGGPAVNAGATQIRVDSTARFQVGQQIQFAHRGTLRSWTTSGTTAGVNCNDVNWGDYSQSGTSPARQFILARGTAREWVMATWDYIYGGATIYRNNADFPTNLQAGDTIEDYQALLEPARTITDITGDVLTLDAPLTYQQMQFARVYAINVTATAQLEIQSSVIEESNPLRVVVKQSGVMKQNSANVSPDLTVDLRWYFYAGKGFTRLRVRVRNATNDINRTVSDALIDELKLRMPLSFTPTAADDHLTDYQEAMQRYQANNLTSTVGSSVCQLAVPEFPENFPQRLRATGAAFEWFPLPARQDGQPNRFPADWAKTWDLYFGQDAATGLPLTGRTAVTLDAAYTCATNAIQHGLAPARTWTASEAGTTRTAEALNRFEQELAAMYALERCDDQPNVTEMSAFEYRISDLVAGGTSFARGRMLGWDVFGEFRDGDDDGYTRDRYNVGFSFSREFIRTGDARAFRLGNEIARYMADGGLMQSAKAHNGNTGYNLQGLNRYERSTSTRVAQPTHDWAEGLFLNYALTGDPILYEAILLKQASARRWNYNGILIGPGQIDGGLSSNEARGPGWQALILLASYWYFGDSADLTKCQQYLNNLRLSEESQGSRGVYVAPGYETNSGEIKTGTQPFIWLGYPARALRQYLAEKRSQNAPDATLEAFARRCALWATRGDARSATPTNNRVIRGGIMNGSQYTPLGLPYSWYANSNTDTVGTSVSLDYFVTLSLFTAANVGGPADELIPLARQMSEDIAFYLRAADGPRDYAQRTPIGLPDRMYFGNPWKIKGQHALAYPDLIWELAGRTVFQAQGTTVSLSLASLNEPQVEAGDKIRVEFLPSEQFRVTWRGMSGTLKGDATITLPVGLVNEPIGVKLLATPGAVCDLGIMGRVAATNNGCLNIYDDYQAQTPALTLNYGDAGELKDYPWQAINVKGLVYEVEICGTGAEQKPAHVLLDGQIVPSHLQ